jgi:hypothetical protein
MKAVPLEFPGSRMAAGKHSRPRRSPGDSPPVPLIGGSGLPLAPLPHPVREPRCRIGVPPLVQDKKIFPERAMARVPGQVQGELRLPRATGLSERSRAQGACASAVSEPHRAIGGQLGIT